MGIQIEPPKITEMKPRITVIGVGGAGGNAIANMIATGLDSVEFVVANTDAQALAMSTAERRIQLGKNLTEGLGAGAQPDIGHAAAEEAADEIRAELEGAHMVFLAAGMGGGTGTGAVPVIARIARELGILTVGIVTKPFHFEGSRRMRIAEEGIAELKPAVDTLIVIPNQNLFRIASEKTTFAEAFVLADQILYSGIACIVDLIVKDGLINLDFADVKAVMKGMGAAMMGTGEASGEKRATLAAEQAIANPLLDDVSLAGAKGLLVSIIGGHDMSLFDVDAAASRVKEDANPDANIIVGASFDETLEDRIRVSIVASGMDPAPSQRIPVTANAATAVPPPPPPTGSTAASPGPETDPYLGHYQPDEFADVLSEAVGRSADELSTTTASDHGASAEWQSPGGVTIEEVEPGLPSRPAPPPLPGGQASADPHASASGFAAAPPAEIPQTVPRIPDVAAFPEVAQREYYAKRGTPDSDPAANAGGAKEQSRSLMRRLGMPKWGGQTESVEKNTHQEEHARAHPNLFEPGEEPMRNEGQAAPAPAAPQSPENLQPVEQKKLFGR